MVEDPSSDCNEIEEFTINKAAARFEADRSRLVKLHDSVKVIRGSRFVEKILYRYMQCGKEFILRLTHPRYIDFKLIAGEVDWINYLADTGMNVPRAVPSDRGNLVEIIGEGVCPYALVSFEKAKGEQINFDNSEEWNAEFFEKYGQTIGRMHALSKGYKPADKSLSRLQWQQQDWIANRNHYLPPSESLVRRKYDELLKTLHRLQQNRDSFGLIHGDAHPWNLLYHEGNLVLTDFDFCEHSWFASEIAIILFYAVMAPIEGMDKDSFARHFLEYFMTGYEEENSLDSYWLERIPDFLKLRMMSKYALYHQEWGSGIMTERRRSAFLEWKHKIENDIPYLDL
jgi:Ser/Thr protein kinase RdoA (MazF antagonist)